MLEAHIGRLIPPNEIGQLKLQISNEAVTRWPENPIVGLEIGKAYKSLTYNLVAAWYDREIPEDLKDHIGIAAFGSTGRGELCYYSDSDLAIFHDGGIKKKIVEDYKKKLTVFLENSGLRPEVKVWGIRPRMQRLLKEDLVQAEMISSSELVVGHQTDLEALRNLVRNDPRAKALYTIFELKKPRFIKTEEDVFNLKWEKKGGLINFMALRSIATAYGLETKTTIEALNGLQRLGVINTCECQFLSIALSEYMIYRNQMHIFAGDEAERLGSRTRRFIAQKIPQVGSPSQLKDRLETLKTGVSSITKRVMSGFLQEVGIDPNLYENFTALPIEEQLAYAHSSDKRLVELAAWSSENPAVLNACLQTAPSWSTLNAIARSKTASNETFKLAEKLTRYREELDFARMQLIVNPALPVETLTNIYLYTNNDRAKNLVKKRLAYIQYEGHIVIPSNLKHQVDSIIFYPLQNPLVGLLDRSDILLQPTQGKLYLNFAGRLAQGKNVVAYLRILEALHQKGVDFEAHIFGVAEPICVAEIQEFWDTVKDFSFVNKIKYHGRYTLEELAQNVKSMQEAGSPLFLLPKGLVSKELLSMGMPIFTTKEGNYDIEQSDMCALSENNLSAVIVATQIMNYLNNPKDLSIIQVERARTNIQSNYSLECWGRQLANVFEDVQPHSQNVVLLGTSPLDGPHGPATWSRNLMRYLDTTGWKGQYVYSKDIMQPLAQRADMPLKNEIVQKNILEHLHIFVSSILKIREEEINQEAINSAYNALICLSYSTEAPNVLTTREAQNAFNLAVVSSGFDPTDIHYPSTVLDEVNIYRNTINPFLKLVRWIHLLKQPLPEAGVIVSQGTLHPLLALREKQQKGTPFIHVDHILASDETLLRGITNNGFYSDLEKKWFVALNTFLRRLTFSNLDRYIALWPVNQKVASLQFGLEPDKIIYIPNAVYIRP